MGIYEFNILTEHDKYDTVFTKGQFVDSVTVGDIRFVLYALSYLWVEVEYHAPGNKIQGVASFVEGGKLNRYSNLPRDL